MRIGTNPAKGTKVEINDSYHRIIIPVYIPNLEDFFKESLGVLKLCLQSLYTTLHTKSKITVVSNGSCNEVNEFLFKEQTKKNIDELFIITSGIGKINSIRGALNNIKEPLVTLTDADVLFKSGWQEEVEQIFIDYNKVGMICPFSYTKGYRELTANIFFDNLFNKKIRINPVKDKKDILHFAKSIGNPNFYKGIHLKKAITYQEKGKSKVFIGAGHFVSSFRSSVFDYYTFKSFLNKMSDGERKFIDTPAVNFNLWRVSTYRNYVYHMGNTLNDMYENVIKTNSNSNFKQFNFNIKLRKTSKFLFFLKNKLFARVIYSNKIFPFFLRKIGLTKSEAKKYIRK